MICPNCQKETPVANCCMHCGAVLNTTSIPSVTTETVNQPKKKKGGAFALILLIIGIVIGVIVGLAPSGPTGSTVLEITYEDGTVSQMTYYYKNDVVYKIIDCAVLPLAEGITETDIDMIEAQLDLTFAGVKELDYCDIKYSHDETTFTLTITSSGLDQIENLKTLIEAGVLDADNSEELVSFERSKEALIADGYKVISENND